MQRIQLFVILALIVSVVLFVIATQVRRRRDREGGLSLFRSGNSPSFPPAFTLKTFYQKVGELRTANAQWTQILDALNPTGDVRVAQLLDQIRGPHMFDPRTALGVIEDGCRSVPSGASYIEAIEAAVASMNKVVRYGD